MTTVEPQVHMEDLTETSHSMDESLSSIDTRRVTFEENPQMKLILQRSEYTPDEAKATWYRGQELDAGSFKGKTILTKLPMNKQADGGKKFALSGKCRETVSAVISEYKIQKQKGKPNERVLADFYRQSCKANKMEAYLKGLSDAREAKGIQQEIHSPTTSRWESWKSLSKTSRWLRGAKDC
eukprot:Nitzschia sp. Nitz4//scaffold186_size43309//25429//25974//NITZ4_007320-RA/size43309-processed-gene-0.30-mRNA-1//1//CDS//3329539767//2557//frame0